MDLSEKTLSAFATDIMSYPVGEEVYVCASFLDGGAPDHSQAGAKAELTPEMALQHTRTDFSEEGEEDLWAAGFRGDDEWIIRVREMAARPDRPTRLIAEIVEALSEKQEPNLRYTFAPHHFNGFDIYVAHAELGAM